MTIGTGVRIRDYIVIKQLGKGGMGEVWLARDIYLDREVAIKFLVPLSPAMPNLPSGSGMRRRSRLRSHIPT